MVQMRSNASEGMILVGIADLGELNVFSLKCSRQKHSLLKVYVVVQSAMDNHVSLVVLLEVVNVIHQAASVVAELIVSGNWKSHEALRVN